MSEPNGDVSQSVALINTLLDMMTNLSDLNEFKHTQLPR
jgi:hypothetical protein